MSESVAAFHSVPWMRVQLCPGPIKEMILLVHHVCTCSSKTLTTLINCAQSKTMVGSSISIETKVGGQLSHANQSCMSLYVELWLLEKNTKGNMIYFTFICSKNVQPVYFVVLFMAQDDKDERVQGGEMPSLYYYVLSLVAVSIWL